MRMLLCLPLLFCLQDDALDCEYTLQKHVAIFHVVSQVENHLHVGEEVGSTEEQQQERDD